MSIARLRTPWMMVFVFLLAISIQMVTSFNIATKGSILFSPPTGLVSERNSYFGYSVGLVQFQNQTSRLLVGAPRANVTGYTNLKEPGSFYKCNIDRTDPDCEEVVLDVSRNGDQLIWDFRTHRHYAWAGATIDSNEKGEVVICAPRSKTGITLNLNHITGLCYKMEQDWTKLPTKIVPMLNSDSYTYPHRNKYVFYYAHGQGGMSAHFLRNSSNFLVGGTGVFNWQGIVGEVKKKRSDRLPGGSRRKRSSPRDYQFWAPGPSETSTISDFSYFGYSVTSGEFVYGQTYYVGGAPRSKSLLGMVLVFELYEQNFLTKMSIKETKLGTQLGEYFGASLGAPDLDGDGLSDLVVGAPFHSKDGHRETGCIYVFRSSATRGLEGKGTKIEVKTVPGARFGSSIGLPGDLNGDVYEDVLIGAPYDGESGAVYVFNGYNEGIQLEYSQKLTPKEHFPGVKIRGFGVSFSRPIDIDKNQYPDIAIGSFMSNHVAIVYTRPVVLLSGYLASVGQLNEGTKLFKIASCSSFEGHFGPTLLDVQIQIEISSALLPTGSISFTQTGKTKYENVVQLSKLKEMCSSHDVVVAEGFTFQHPLVVTMTQALWFRPEVNGSVEAPVADPQEALVQPIEISFITGCEKDGDPKCTTKLELSASIKDHSFREAIVIGKVELVTLVIDVLNTGEPAFSPNVTIQVQDPIRFAISNPKCMASSSVGKKILVCQLLNPIKTKDQFNVELDLTGLSDTSLSSSINITISSASDEELSSNNYQSVPLKFSKDINVQASGYVDPEHVLFERLSENEIATNGTYQLTHISTISKIGATPIKQMDISLILPTHVMNEYEEFFPILQINTTKLLFYGQPETCRQNTVLEPRLNAISGNYVRNYTSLNCSSGLFRCQQIECNAGPWNQRVDAASLEVQMILNMTTLSQLMSAVDGSAIITEIEAAVSQSVGVSPANTWYVNKLVKISLIPAALHGEQSIPWWIYLIAILGGILFIALLVYGLYKVGFFQRKKRDDMAFHQANLIKNEETPKS